MDIQVLIENTVFKKGLISEHGLSLLLEKGSDQIIIDTGQSGKFVHNALQMNIDLTKIKKVILTHGHYDHVGGLKRFLEMNKNAAVYANKQILNKKYAKRTNGLIEEIGFDAALYETNKNNFVLMDQDQEISKNLFLISDMMIKYDNDYTTNNFLVDNNNTKNKDEFLDELFIVIKEKEDIHIISGCSHKGILNVIYTAEEKFKGHRIKTIVGGFHVKGMHEKDVIEIAEVIKQYDIDKIYTGHCTGIEEYAVLKKVLGEKLSYITTGCTIIL